MRGLLLAVFREIPVARGTRGKGRAPTRSEVAEELEKEIKYLQETLQTTNEELERKARQLTDHAVWDEQQPAQLGKYDQVRFFDLRQAHKAPNVRAELVVILEDADLLKRLQPLRQGLDLPGEFRVVSDHVHRHGPVAE